MTNYYLGTTPSGRLLKRASNNPKFTHAAIRKSAEIDRLPNFGTSEAGALKNCGAWDDAEVAPVRLVSPDEYKAAVAAGIDKGSATHPVTDKPKKERKMARPAKTLMEKMATAAAPKVPRAPKPPKDATPATARVTKAQQVLELIGREDGATGAEIMNLTGWLAHTTRAAITGLRHKGNVIIASRNADGVTVYLLKGTGVADEPVNLEAEKPKGEVMSGHLVKP